MLSLDLQPLRLAGERRRVRLLAASELVVNALRHAFAGRQAALLAMKAILTQEEAAFHGKFVQFDPIWSYPKPAQKPHPPVLLGGETDHTLKRVVEFGDGWLPRAVRGFDAKQAVDRLRRMALAAGRDPSTLSITVFGAPADPAVLSEYRQDSRAF